MRRDDQDSRWLAFRNLLLRGPVTVSEATRVLGISQSTFSRAVRAWGERVIVSGKGPATVYLGARELLDAGGSSVPLTEVLPDGGTRKLGELHGALDRAYFFETAAPGETSRYFEDLPYFLHELRPAGFLGRLIPRQHPELGFPADITLWTGDQVIAYASRFGWDLPGSLIMGREAFQRFLQRTREPGDFVAAGDRGRRYPDLAADVLATGPVGSSAAGEQPKFLVARSPDGRAALVKFSPPGHEAVARRTADLLIAEHLAAETMRAHGQTAARTEILQAADRVFLESERFDRLPGHGRRGVLSSFALAAEHTGDLSNWIDTASALVEARVLPAEVGPAVRWRQRFGELIGNSDMHAGNLSFFAQGTKVESLAPAYDMAPARYAPRQNELPAPDPLRPPLPGPGDGAIWTSVCEAAAQFWDTVGHHELISRSFRALALENLVTVRQYLALGRRLPADG